MSNESWWCPYRTPPRKEEGSMKELVLTSNKIIVFVELIRSYRTSPIYSEDEHYAISVWTSQVTLENILHDFTKNLQYYRAEGTCALKN